MRPDLVDKEKEHEYRTYVISLSRTLADFRIVSLETGCNYSFDLSFGIL